jgi:hypothetical protein
MKDQLIRALQKAGISVLGTGNLGRDLLYVDLDETSLFRNMNKLEINKQKWCLTFPQDDATIRSFEAKEAKCSLFDFREMIAKKQFVKTRLLYFGKEPTTFDIQQLVQG